MYKDKIIELCIFHIDEKDNRIENLQAVNDTYQGEIFKLEAEIKRLKGVLDMDSSLDDAIIKDAELIRELKAEIKLDEGVILARNKEVDELKAENVELKAENKRLQGRNGRLVLKQTLLNDKDGLYDEVKELQAENDGLAKLVVDLKAEIKLLSCDDIDDCGCVIPMEYKQEARDYMNHNPKVKKVYFFMVADDCISDDGYAQDWSCCVDDAVAVINNE